VLIVPLLIVVCYLLYKILKPEPQEPPVDLSPKPPPKPRPFTKEELLEFDGTNNKPIYIGCKGKVFDMSSKADFYGSGGPYAAFAGRNASRALALHSVDPEVANNPSLEGLDQTALSSLDEWFDFFSAKYPVVGYISDGNGSQPESAKVDQPSSVDDGKAKKD